MQMKGILHTSKRGSMADFVPFETPCIEYSGYTDNTVCQHIMVLKRRGYSLTKIECKTGVSFKTIKIIIAELTGNKGYDPGPPDVLKLEHERRSLKGTIKQLTEEINDLKEFQKFYKSHFIYVKCPKCDNLDLIMKSMPYVLCEKCKSIRNRAKNRSTSRIAA